MAGLDDTWGVLELAPTEDRTAIRRAYARRLKVTNPEDDAAGFAKLRVAYEAALAYADARAVETDDSDESSEDSQNDGFETGRPASSWQSLRDRPLIDRDAAAKPSPLLAEFAAAHATAQNQVESVFASPATDAARLAALHALLSSPLLDRAETVEATEAFLTLLLVDHWPQSDVLIKPVVAHFGWTIGELNSLDVDIEQRSMRQWLCRRGRDLSFLRAMSNPDHEYHALLQVLSRPPQPATWHNLYFPVVSPKSFTAFMGRVRRSHPTIMATLDPNTIAYWEQKLAKPRVPTVAVWMSTIAVIGLIAAIVSWFAVSPEVSGAIATLFALPIIWSAGHLALIYGYAWPRRWWKRQGEINSPPFVKYGWAAMIFVPLLLAPLPSSPAITCLVISVSLAVAWWVIITGDANARPAHWPWFIRAAFGEFPIGIVAILTTRDLPIAASWQVAFAWLAMSFVSCFGRQPLLALWEGLPAATRKRGLWGAIASCLAAIVFLWLGYAENSLRPWCFPVIAGAILVYRVPALIVDGRYAILRRLTLGIGVFISATQANDPKALPILATLILGLATVNGVLAGMSEDDASRSARPGRVRRSRRAGPNQTPSAGSSGLPGSKRRPGR